MLPFSTWKILNLNKCPSYFPATIRYTIWLCRWDLEISTTTRPLILFRRYLLHAGAKPCLLKVISVTDTVFLNDRLEWSMLSSENFGKCVLGWVLKQVMNIGANQQTDRSLSKNYDLCNSSGKECRRPVAVCAQDVNARSDRRL